MSATLERFVLVVIAAYGSDDLSIAATRSFLMQDVDGRRDPVPASTDTDQIASRRKSRQVCDMLQQHL